MGDSWLFDPAHETTDISPQRPQRNKPHHLLRVTDRELELAILCLAGGQGMALGVNPIRNSSGFLKGLGNVGGSALSLPPNYIKFPSLGLSVSCYVSYLHSPFYN